MSFFNFGKLTQSDFDDLVDSLTMWASHPAVRGVTDVAVNAEPEPDADRLLAAAPMASVKSSLPGPAKQAAT